MYNKLTNLLNNILKLVLKDCFKEKNNYKYD